MEGQAIRSGCRPVHNRKRRFDAGGGDPGTDYGYFTGMHEVAEEIGLKGIAE